MYAGFHKVCIRQMTADSKELPQGDKWKNRAQGFNQFEPDRGRIKPSEWYILLFFLLYLFGRHLKRGTTEDNTGDDDSSANSISTSSVGSSSSGDFGRGSFWGSSRRINSKRNLEAADTGSVYDVQKRQRKDGPSSLEARGVSQSSPRRQSTEAEE
ncbi:hypothetical protein B0H66DRAFT_569345 [Apodospora peruviana]|uniref:Uncharacterized protein n=1 Tax=Apodospora peruviana TaxID=516989 RepID=A0AAE0HU87_9PEZI|nr:hypothetical protein B0H66DRAFT_569345 [Apodospora peruviana]